MRRRSGFTLTELLVVMAAIAILSTLTLVSVRAITAGARLAQATNSVVAALEAGRSLAIKTNRPTLVAFYPRFEGDSGTRIDVITAAWTGDSFIAEVLWPDNATPQVAVFDRFRPLAAAPVRSLPAGINVAGPAYTLDADETWVVPTNIARASEATAPLVGVLFGGDGTTLMDNPANDSDFFWIDFNDTQLLEMDRDGNGEIDPNDPNERVFQAVAGPVPLAEFTELRHPADEVAINIVPFVAVFSESRAREIYDTSLWSDPVTRTANLTTFISEEANRLHFNRYTGVVMK